MGSILSTAVPKPPPAVDHHDAEDLISGLPDELLHAILVRLPSAKAAAHTSVLSRRWRGVWAHMPDLVFQGSFAPSTSSSALLDSIAGALGSYAAALHSLEIGIRGVDRCDVHADRIAPWLRFASQRLAGKLCISLFSMNDYRKSYHEIEIEEELTLPICERATEIKLDFRLRFSNKFVLRTPQAGSFSALTDLTIACAQMDGGELGRVVSTLQCPRLRKLVVLVSKLVPVSGVSMRSESLECLKYISRAAKLEVTAPVLREIVLQHSEEACIVAPKLEKIDWLGTYGPGRHQLAVASRHIQSLSIKYWSSCFDIPTSSTPLMERFDTATEMAVSLELDKDIAGYVTFLKEMDKLPKCETLVINLRRLDKHGLLPTMLCILRRSICIKKFKLSLSRNTPSKILSSCTMTDCPCLHPESYRSDDITLDSLEEIGISFFTGSAEQQDFIEVLLSRCNMVTLKRLDIMVPSTDLSSEITKFVESIRTIYSKVQLNVLTREVPKPRAS